VNLSALFLLAAVGAALAASVATVRAVRLTRLAAGGRLYRLALPAAFDEGALEQLLLALHGLLRPAVARVLFGQPWIGLEIFGSEQGVEFRLWAPRHLAAGTLERHVAAALPGAILEPATEGRWPTARTAALAVTTAGAGLIRMDTPRPGLAALLGGLRGLRSGERVLVQLLLEPLSPAAQGRLLAEAERRLAGRRVGEQRLTPTVADRAVARRLQAKAATPLFAVAVRVAAEALSRAHARTRAAAVAAGLHQFATAELHFRRHPTLLRGRLLRSIEERRLPLIPAPTALNSVELGALLRLTPELAREAGVRIAGSRELAPPPEVARKGRVIGVARTAAGERPVALSAADSRRHLHITGPTGTGKSTLLLNLAVQDLEAGRGVVVLDPKGDLVSALLERLPRSRERDLVLFDPAETRRPLGLNLLELGAADDPDLVCDQLVAIFRGIYSQFWGPRTDDILRAAIATLLHEPGATLCEVPLLLSDDGFRAPYLAKLDDPVALEPFWAWYEGLSATQRAEAVGPVLNKLRSVLMQRRLRNIVGQSRSSLDLPTILARRGVLFVSLAKGLVGEEASALLGSLVLAKLWQATLARAGVAEAARPDVSVYVDEFQDVLPRLPMAFQDVLAQARAYRLGLTLAHQHATQLPPELRQAMLANVRSRVVFQSGAADARLLAREFEPFLSERDLRSLEAFQVAAMLASSGSVGRPFTARTLPAPPGRRRDVAALRARSATRHGRPRAEVEAAIRARLTAAEPVPEQFGRRRIGFDRSSARSAEEAAQHQ
jgi:hypothetical protein